MQIIHILNAINLISLSNFEQLLLVIGFLLLVVIILGFFKVLEIRKENKVLKEEIRKNSRYDKLPN